MHYNQQAASLSIDEQHLAILACCDELLAALRSASPIGDVGQVRMRLAGLLHANLSSEEAELNGPIRRLPASERPRSFAEMTDEAATLRSRYSEHVGRWSLAAISQDTAGYARAAGDLIRQTKAHLTKKRAALPDWRRALAAGHVAETTRMQSRA